MKRYLFIDTVCPKPYSPAITHAEALGGTEATVMRVADALAKTCEVHVMQHNRVGNPVHFTEGAWYEPLIDELLNTKWDAIISIRSPQPLPLLRRRCPDTPLFLWAHDLAGTWLSNQIQSVIGTKTTVIAVSNFHRTNMVEYLKGKNLDIPPIAVIYNCIDDNLKPKGVEFDPTKLVFFSSPHKGLPYALAAFRCLLRIAPHFKLYISNPGYVPNYDTQGKDNVVNLGSLPHEQILDHVSNSLCVFYPNWTFPETFGLVFAEANALGVPVITHNHGAAREILKTDAQVMDVKTVGHLVTKVIAWSEGDRPKVEGQAEFRTSEVIKQWMKLI